MAAVMPTSKTRLVIVTPVLGWKGIISNTREIADHVRRVDKVYRGVGKDKAGMLESYSRKSFNPR
jgi:hypothetical protein